MRRRAMHLILWVAIFTVGYALGVAKHAQVNQPQIRTAAVDCYYSDGSLVKNDWGAQFGGTQVGCAPGQTAKIHQTSH